MYNTTDDYKSKIYDTVNFLKVYINDIEVEPRYIGDCKPSSTLFTNGEIELGSTPSQTVELQLHKTAVPDSITKIEIKSGITGEIVPIGVYNVDKISKVNDYTVSLTLSDNMTKFEFNYDGSNLIKDNDGKAKIIQVLQDICLKAGVELGSASFLNMNKEIAVCDNTVSARTYLSYISEQAGGFAFIGRDGKLYIRSLGQDTANISLKLFQNFEWGEKYKITRVRFDDGIRAFEKGNTTGNTVYINPDNMFIVDQEQVDNIYEQVKDLELYSFKGDSIIDPAIDIGDILVIDGKQILYQGSSQYSGRWKASISSEIKSKERQETTVIKKPSQKTINRRVQSSINQIDGKVEQLIEENTETTEKLTKHEQDIDSIKNTVLNIQDFTREKEQNNNLFLDDIAAGEGYVLSFIVYGNSTTFNSKDVTICAGTKPRGVGNLIYLITESGEDLLTEDGQEFIVGEKSYYVKSQKVHLSDVLRNLKINDNTIVYDTLEVFQDGTIQVTRRIGIDSLGNKYILEKEVIEKLDEKFVLPSTSGENYFFIEECEALTYKSRYIIQNDYSKTFLTKLELGTKIEQNAEHIRIAWNQISQFLQLEDLEGKATLSIYDKDEKLLMTLDDSGQHFYENNEKFGEMGVSVEQKDEKTKNSFIAFAIDGEYDKEIDNGMAWGVKAKSDGKFYPILYLKDFTMPPKNSGGCTGKLTLSGCDLLLDSELSGIVMTGVRVHGDAIPGMYFDDEIENKTLLSIMPALGNNAKSIRFFDNVKFENKNDGSVSFSFGNKIKFEVNSDSSAGLSIGDKIKFVIDSNGNNSFEFGNNISLFYNMAGSNSLRVGDNETCVVLTDSGNINASGLCNIDGILTANELNVETTASCSVLKAWQHIYCNNGVESFSTIEKKKNVRKYTKSAIKEIMNTDIYWFNYKEDDKNSKRRLGTVIGEGYNCSKDILSQTGESISDYSMISLAYKAIQEQQEEIEKMQKEKNEKDKIINNLIERIEKLEGGK